MAISQEEIAKLRESGWTPEQVAQLLAVESELTAEAELIEDIREAARVASESPTRKLLERQAELAQKKAERARLSQEKAGDEVYAQVVVKFGESRVGRIHTLDGAIIMRALTQQEVDMGLARSVALNSVLEQAKLSCEIAAGTVLFPERPAFDATMQKYPGLWKNVFELRDKLTEGVREETEKKG